MNTIRITISALGALLLCLALTGCSAWDTIDRTYAITKKATVKAIKLTEKAVDLNRGKLNDAELQTLKDLKSSLIDLDTKAQAARPALEKVLDRP